ncbi:MAG: 2-C-methyl-D-erythritol 4-phosphate cytidylyltransferase [Caldisericia bacterium]
MKIAGIIAAGGNSSRFGQDKLSLKFSGKSVLTWSVSLLSLHQSIDFVVVAIADHKLAKKQISGFTASNIEFSEPGTSRAETIFKALQKIPDDYDAVFVHDGARPFATSKLIDSILSRKTEAGCIVPILPIDGAVKKISADHRISDNIADKLYVTQTPQFAYLKPLRFAYEKFKGNLERFRDTAHIMSEFGISVLTVPGETTNIKITHQSDVTLANAIAGCGVLKRR